MVDVSGSTLAGLLKQLRVSARLTQEELAEAAGISVRAVSDLERGVNRTARKDTVRLLSDALGLSGAAREVFEAVARGLQDPSGAAGHEEAGGLLPVPPTPLVGRSADVTACSDLLLRSDVRLVTVTGLGGVGKTRTALAVAGYVEQHFRDGVRFVPLAAIQDAHLVAASVARATGVRESGTGALLAQVAARLEPLNVLLLLDNFEQLIDAAASVSGLLSACPEVKFLVTSRRPLRINGEQEYALAPLRLPPTAGASPAELLTVPSVRLLTDRIRAVLPGWELQENDMAAIAGICRRLDGLPLALELAAARAKVLSPSDLLARLCERSDVLSLGARDADLRHRTLQSTLDWSYRLLDPAAAQLLPQLSVFADGWTLDALTRVCETGDEITALDALASLIDNSLVWRADRGAGVRFALPATIHAYAAQLLRAAGTGEAIAGRHLEWFLSFAESSAPDLTSAGQVTSLRLLDNDHANLRAALDYAIRSGNAIQAHRLAAVLWRYWEISGQLAEGRQQLARVQALIAPVPSVIRARTLKAEGNLARDQGDHETALASHLRALTLFEETGDDADIASSLNNIGNVHNDRGETREAISRYENSLRHLARVNDPWQQALVWCNLALALTRAGQGERAARIAQQSLKAFEQLDDVRGIARVTLTLAIIHDNAAEFRMSLPLHQRAIALFSKVGDRAGVSRAS